MKNPATAIFKKSDFILSSLLVVVFFLVLFIHLSQEIRDLDLWLHLKTGEYILTNRIIPVNDIFSFTQYGQPWINHEWLFQVIAYSVFLFSGFNGLIALQNIVFLALFMLLFSVGYHRRNYLTLTTGLFLLLLGASYRFTLRPDMASVLFLAVFLYILTKENKRLFMLPLLQIIWSNIHGFFFLGPIVLFLFAITKRNKQLWIILVLSLAGTLINPQFVKGALYPVSTAIASLYNKFIFTFIQEMHAPLSLKTIFTLKDWFYFKVIILVSLFSFRFNQRRFDASLFLVWAFFLLFALSAIRNIIYFSTAAIFISFHNIRQRLTDAYDIPLFFTQKKAAYYGGRCLLIIAFAACMVSNARLLLKEVYFDFDTYTFKSSLWGISQRNFPVRAADFLMRNDIPERLFNDFNSGSYLIGRCFPKRRVFIDGRTELYGARFLKEYKKSISADKKRLDSFIDKYRFEGFFLSMAMGHFDETLAQLLFGSPEWKLVFFDENAFIFLKDNARNHQVINRNFIDLKSWKASEPNLSAIGNRLIYPEPYLKRSRLLLSLSCFDAALSEAAAAQKINPKVAEAYALMAQSYEKTDKFGKALASYQKALELNPRSIHTRDEYAKLLYTLGDFAHAKENIALLLKAAPRDPDFHHAMALVLKEEGNFKEAKAMIQRALALSPEKKTSYLRLLAELSCELKEYRSALAAYEEINKKEPHHHDIKAKIEKIKEFL